MMEHEVPAGVTATRVDRYLERLLPQVRAWEIREILKRRDVKVNGARVRGDHLVAEGDRIVLYGKIEKQPSLPVVYEDANLILVYKPQGISVVPDEHGGATLTDQVSAHCGVEARPCHRLDHHTGGLILYAKTEEAYGCALEAFRRHAVQKGYDCLVCGCPMPEEAELRGWLRKDAQAARVEILTHPAPGALPIRTRYRVRRPGRVAWLEVDLLTGRTHQIRAHLASIGHPVLGDDRYGDREMNRTYGVRVQQLWATRLCLRAGGVLAYLDGYRFEVPPSFSVQPE